MNELLQPVVNWLLITGNAILYPLMLITLIGAIGLRVLVYLSVRRHQWFAYEFEKRVNRFLDQDDRTEKLSFFVLTKRLLERTFYELFETRDRLKRRKPDSVMSMTDRIFLVRSGTAWLVRDILKQARYLKWGEQPQFLNMTKTVFHKNPYFNRILGKASASGINDILNILPGMFVIAGIFGTFVGIMQGLPILENMDLANIEATQQKMSHFLNKVTFSMGTSVVGIVCSVTLSFLNTMLAPEKVYVGMVDRFENAMFLLWQRADNNQVPADGMKFDENRDAVEALAEAAVNQELAKRRNPRDGDFHARPDEKKVS